MPKDTTPVNFPLQVKGPPLSLLHTPVSCKSMHMSLDVFKKNWTYWSNRTNHIKMIIFDICIFISLGAIILWFDHNFSPLKFVAECFHSLKNRSFVGVDLFVTFFRSTPTTLRISTFGSGRGAPKFWVQRMVLGMILETFIYTKNQRRNTWELSTPRWAHPETWQVVPTNGILLSRSIRLTFSLKSIGQTKLSKQILFWCVILS